MMLKQYMKWFPVISDKKYLRGFIMNSYTCIFYKTASISLNTHTVVNCSLKQGFIKHRQRCGLKGENSTRYKGLLKRQ